MFQLRNTSFAQIQRKKRLDRVLQVAILTAAMAGFGKAIKECVKLLARATGTSQVVVSTGMVAAAAAAGVVNKIRQGRQAKASSA